MIHHFVGKQKAVLKGQIISYSTYEEKKEQEERSLEKKIKELEIMSANNPTSKIQSDLQK